MLESIFFAVLKISMESGVIGLLILLLRTIIRHKLPKAFLMCLWAVMFLRLAVPLEIPSPTSIYNLFPTPSALKPETPLASHLLSKKIRRRLALLPCSWKAFWLLFGFPSPQRSF
jgi:beta-lactamase regulating signal transducer with metallopeptidase domain